MQGYAAVTDPDWWRRLAREPGPKDANFWRPSARRRRLAIGTPFFKLKAPFRKIAGFGYFAGFSVLPDWLAWDSFRIANGVTSLKELRSRLSKIQAGARIQSDPAGNIGCCLIAESVFFPEEAWIDPPEDWSPRTQSGASIDLSRGDGARIWRGCLEHAATRAAVLVSEPRERYGEPVLHRPRLGQAIFRIRVLDSYDRACAVTTEHSLPVLDAAHIKPFAEGGAHDVRNGLTLRTDLHRLFDRGYVTVDEDDRFVVGNRLREEFENGKTYYALHGSKLALPGAPELRPSAVAMSWHRSEVFVG